MFKDNFVLSIKNNEGQILREYSGGTVYLPFYSEFKLYLKNLRNQRAVVSVKIDGTDVLGGSQLVIGPNDSQDLERFIKDGNFLKGKKFKFVPVAGNAADPSSPNNGQVEITAQWEATNYINVPWTVSSGTYFYPLYPIPPINTFKPIIYPSTYIYHPTTAPTPTFHTTGPNIVGGSSMSRGCCSNFMSSSESLSAGNAFTNQKIKNIAQQRVINIARVIILSYFCYDYYNITKMLLI